MSPSDLIKDLAGHIQADMNAVLGYYVNSQHAWRLVQRQSEAGDPIDLFDQGIDRPIGGDGLAILASSYITRYLAESVFQHIVSLFEDFLFGLLQIWLLAHPRGIPQKEEKSVRLTTILDASDKDAILQLVVEQELNRLKYERPSAWFEYLNARVKLGVPTVEAIERLTEIKAARDILAHNRGVVNETYLKKAGGLARFAVDQQLEIPEPYLRESWLLIQGVVAELSEAAIAKA